MTKEDYIKNAGMLEQLPVFYQPWYLDIFGLNWNVESWQKENETWIFPYFDETRSLFRLNRTPFATPYYGPVCIPGMRATMPEDAALHFAKFAQRFALNSWTPLHYVHCDNLAAQGFRPVERVTHILSLEPDEAALFANMDYMRRKNIRKAEKELRIEKGIFDTNRYFDWIGRTYEKRDKKAHIDRQLLERYVATVLENDAAFCNSIFNEEGTLLSMSLVLHDGQTAYSILGANNPDLKHSAATTALLWQSIREAKAKGCRFYDFEGSSIPEIARFFSKFGSERVEYRGWEKVNSFLWRLKTRLRG